MQFESSSFLAAPDLIAALSKHAIEIDCEPGHALFRQGETPTGVFVVHAGKAQITMESRGKSVISIDAQPGSLLGLPAVLSNAPYSLTARAGQGARVKFIPREQFSKMMISEPLLALRVVEVLAAEVRSARSAIMA